MAGNNKSKPKPAPEEKPSEYTQAELLAQAQAIFGQPRFVVVGAFHGAKDPLTLEEAKALVKSFLTKEVKS